MKKLLKAMEDDVAGAGLSTAFSDTAYWLDWSIDDRWLDAIVAADQKQPAALIALLRPLVPSAEMPFLADLLNRTLGPRVRGGQRTPLYNKGRTKAVYQLAFRAIDAQLGAGVSERKAIHEIAAQYGLDEVVLRRNYLKTSSGYARELRK
jgi:hypothetical protein